jgi:hypothetical protein
MSDDSPTDPSAYRPVDEVFAALLAKARTQQAAREKLESASNLLFARQARDANLLAEKMQWRPETAVAIIEEQTCRACGCVSQTFKGFGILMRRRVDKAERILTTHGLDEGLPIQRYYMPWVSEACIECLPERGI